VTNLAVDLRDGLRLCRLTELLLQPGEALQPLDGGLLNAVKFPSDRRALQVGG